MCLDVVPQFLPVLISASEAVEGIALRYVLRKIVASLVSVATRALCFEHAASHRL